MTTLQEIQELVQRHAFAKMEWRIVYTLKQVACVKG